MAEQRWLPLESNPEVMNKYVHALGLPEDWKFIDVFSLEDDLLDVVPQPVAAVLLLYPLTDNCKSANIGSEDKSSTESGLYFIKQYISNACGTIGLVHAISNNANKIAFIDGKHFKEFINVTNKMNPEERGKYLQDDRAFGDAHEKCAQEGQTQVPSRDEDLKLHFITFVHHSGYLYELDGRKDAPVKHGKTSPNTLLQDTALVIKKFMQRDPEEMNWTIVALVKE